MSTRVRTGRVRSVYEFIKSHRDQYPVDVMCRILDVAPSGYYDGVIAGHGGWPGAFQAGNYGESTRQLKVAEDRPEYGQGRMGPRREA